MPKTSSHSQNRTQGSGAKKPVDPIKSVLRLPTPTTLRKEAGATADEIANSDPKAARKYGKAKVKEVRENITANEGDGCGVSRCLGAYLVVL